MIEKIIKKTKKYYNRSENYFKKIKKIILNIIWKLF